MWPFPDPLIWYRTGETILCTIHTLDTPLSNINYRHVPNISRTLVGNNIVDHSDVVGASPVGAAPTTSTFST